MTVTVVVGALAVLVFDTVGSFASRRFGFAYSRLAPGSFLLYLLVGLATARTGSLGAAAIAGVIVALVEATVGWAISWCIGPGRLADEHATTTRIVGTVATVAITGAFFGMAGGVVWWILFGRSAAP
jgi:hypothetical protein